MTTIAANSPAPALTPRELASGFGKAAGRFATQASTTSAVAKETQSTASQSIAVDDVSSSPEQSSLESVLATLRRALSAVSNVGRLLDHVGSTAAAAVHAVSKQRAGIEIHTQEGDVVRINYSSRTELNADAVQASGTDSSVSTSQASVSQRERLRVSVDGNLNADELKAIDAVLAKVNSLATEFFAGDFDKAFAQAAAFNFDSTQLADVAVRLSQRQSVSVVAAEVTQLPQPAAGEKPPVLPVPVEPATDPVAVPPVATAPVVPAPAASELAPAAQEQTAAPTAVSEEPAPLPAQVVASPQPEATPVSDASVDKAAVTNSIARYVAKLTASLRVTDNAQHLQIGFHSKLDVLLASIKAQQPDSAPLDAAVKKLQDVAGKAAALS